MPENRQLRTGGDRQLQEEAEAGRCFPVETSGQGNGDGDAEEGNSLDEVTVLGKATIGAI